MRLTSAIWFAVFIRNETQRGAYVTVARTGAQEAGALFIVHNHLNGTLSLYAPAPQAMLEERRGREFEQVLECVSQEIINAYLDKQVNFDPDLWIIETESGQGSPVFNID